MNNTALLFATILLVSILGLILSVVAFSYRQLIKKYYILRDQTEADKKASEDQARKILDQARKEAEEIISLGTVFRSKLQAGLESELKKASANQEQNYQKILDTIQLEAVKMISNMSNSIGEEIVKEYQSMVKQATAKRLTELDESIYQIISQVAHEALGASLKAEDQEKLIFESLKAAKTQNLI